MRNELLEPEYLKKYFCSNGYSCLTPCNIVNKNNDTVFITAGIQPILANALNGELVENSKIYVSQPVIRTQFANNIDEGFSIAFVNSTTSGINISERDHKLLVNDWLNLFYELGMSKEKITASCKEYERQWGDLVVSGHKKFYYYNGIELGDTTYFKKITKDNKKINVETFSDIGFGVERIRWCINYPNSYYDIYSKSDKLSCDIKALVSVLSLLSVNDVKPSNKNSGYRARLFSKKLVNLLNGDIINEDIQKYLNESIKYWILWQEITDINEDEYKSNIINELIRNGNRYILDSLISLGYNNVGGININISREELISRLEGSNVDSKILRKVLNK